MGQAGWDRCRFGERLQAALAGLHELHLLREKQKRLVAAALAMKTDQGTEQPGANPAQSGAYHFEEQRLEATLTVLKDQLSRLRTQDAGLKSHLDQLDQQISELKLDVCKSSNEHLESDSRPSSGFYDLSDGGSCSLSNSCTSVYSECMSSSHSSLKPCSQELRNRLSVFHYRPKSADETTVHVSSAFTNLQQRGVYIKDGAQKQTSDLTGNPTRQRPRPVSTGDLERMIPSDHGFLSAAKLQRVSTFCHGNDLQSHSVDPRYQHDLVSKKGSDIYTYPSPLHAVALQSPLFALSDDTKEGDCPPMENKNTDHAVKGVLLERNEFDAELRLGGYINKLLQLNKCKANKPIGYNEKASEKTQPTIKLQRLVLRSSTGGVKINSSYSPVEKQCCTLEVAKEVNLQKDVQSSEAAKRHAIHGLQEKQIIKIPVTESKATTKCCLSAIEDTSAESLELPSYSSFTSEESNKNNTHLPRKVVPVQKNKKLLNPRDKSSKGIPTQHEFVQASFVSAESHQVKLRMSTSKNKLIKRRNSEKPLRSGRPVFAMDKQRLSEPSRVPDEWIQMNRPNISGGKMLMRRPTFIGEASGRSCSETSLYPVQLRMPQVPPRSHVYRRSSNALHSLDTVTAERSVNKKQRKWQSSVEISVKSQLPGYPGCPRPGLVQNRQPVKKAGVIRTISLRNTSRHHRQVDTYAKSESDYSEYSAECASLFHSTIIETSEEEVSDYTTNRFGDSESSDSDSEGITSSSSLTLDCDYTDESEIVWTEATTRLPVAESMNRPMKAEPKVCRIKASKALKKKIRRFQPASLKVITMV
ncbi:dapper homolog 2 [Spea bombifrons]|uniref:dapper homolog 2 n=1 Tax=Spea bombifrons TaxID=233779 RepID=UPI00234BAA4A|nr:dapper homolog 2 [Spea bombifrons]